MELLDYLRLAGEYEKKKPLQTEASVRLALVTNFTDDLLKKAFTGMCVAERLSPDIYQMPFKQYLFELKNSDSALARHKAEITFIFFDVNAYSTSEFLSNENHLKECLADIAAYSKLQQGAVIIQTLVEPSSLQHGRLLRDSALLALAKEYNKEIAALAETLQNVYLIDTNRLMHSIGERAARDLRGLYAFSQPFSNDFLYAVVREWMAYVCTMRGLIRKCLVLDLDNVLWGGIVGEVGALGIALGPDYPGNAYQEFQRVLLQYYDRGIILALNSRNNPEDVDEVFQKNFNMLLQKSHFAALAINWNSKAENLKAIAAELNIGLDSMVFIDDDPMNRELVRAQLPEVLVPEFSLPPEEYARTLLNLDAFHSLTLTDEDRERGRMYVQERARKAALQSAPTLDEYLHTLNIEMDLSLNNRTLIPRLSQMTQKTNQFNLTTRRFTEQEIVQWMDEENLIFSGDVRDTFGSYGITILAMVRLVDRDEANLEALLMSCRVIGRQVEEIFFRHVVEELRARGYKKMTASFIPTKKNDLSKDFLSKQGGREIERKPDGTIVYEFAISEKVPSVPAKAFINVNLITI